MTVEFGGEDAASANRTLGHGDGVHRLQRADVDGEAKSKNQSIFLIFPSIPFQNMLAKVPSFVRFNVTCGQNTDYDLLSAFCVQFCLALKWANLTLGPSFLPMAFSS